MDLTLYDGRLKNGKEYTLTVQIGNNENGMQPDVLSFEKKKASNYQIAAGTVNWYSALIGKQPVSVLVQEEGESQNTYTILGEITLKNQEEKNLSLSMGEKLYPVRFLFYSPQIKAANQVVLTAKRMDGSNQENLKELNQERGEYVFGGELEIDSSAVDCGVMKAYLPAGEYQFEIETGIAGLGESNGQFTLNQKMVNADEAGTEIVVLNEMQTFEGVLDLSQGDIIFSEQGGNLAISYYQKEADSTESTLKTVPGQSYETVYTIVTSEVDTTNVLKIDTSATQDVKIVVKDIRLQASATAEPDAAPIQINGNSHVFMYLEGESEIKVQKQTSNAPAGISVAENARFTIDCKPDTEGSIEVLSQAGGNSGAAIGGAPEKDAGTIIINGGTVKAELSEKPDAAAIGSSWRKSVKEIQINGGNVTAETSGLGAGIGTGSTFRNDARSGKVVIHGGTINATSSGGAGIGSGANVSILDKKETRIEIHGGIITAKSYRGASIGSGRNGASDVLIDGGTIGSDYLKGGR